MKVYYISGIPYISLDISYFLPYFIQSNTELVKTSIYQIAKIPYISLRYFVIFVISSSVWNW
jgi:hypothetical protein